jgi:hypothetical protein
MNRITQTQDVAVKGFTEYQFMKVFPGAQPLPKGLTKIIMMASNAHVQRL